MIEGVPCAQQDGWFVCLPTAWDVFGLMGLAVLYMLLAEGPVLCAGTGLGVCRSCAPCML